MADEKSFTVTVHSCFTEDGTWSIDVRLDFHDGPPPLGSTLLGVGRVALLQAIKREGQRGRALGAKKVRVRMEGQNGTGVPENPAPGTVTH